MSETLTKIIVNCETGVVAEVPLTGEESHSVKQMLQQQLLPRQKKMLRLLKMQ
jgi:hypothetical protein